VPRRPVKGVRLGIFDDAPAGIRRIDRQIKQMGYLLSKAQKEEIIRQEECVIGGKIVVVMQETVITVAPYRDAVMPKDIKEKFRLAGVPAKIRPYLYTSGITDVMYLEAVASISN